MKPHHLLVCLVLLSACGSPAPEPAAVTETSSAAGLPAAGAGIPPLPDGEGRGIAEEACLSCHSGDILRQQRLTEQQWAANLDKMIGWGAEVAESDKAALVAYLSTHFGRNNTGFEPLAVAPIGATGQ